MVTGSTDGIGKAYAKELAARGINLILISRTLERLEDTKNEILEFNPKVEVKIISADFSKGRENFAKIESQLKDIPIGILGKKRKHNKNCIFLLISFNCGKYINV